MTTPRTGRTVRLLPTLLPLFLALAFFASPAPAAEDCALNVLPERITIGTDYNGASLAITGSVPRGSTAVLRLVGDRGDKHFKQKGKAMGLLWMNLGTVTVKDVPGVLLIGTDDLNAENAADAALNSAGLGFESFQGATDPALFEEFLHLKTHEGLYQVQRKAVSYKADDDGATGFSATLALPSALRKGAYELQLFAIRDGKVVAETTRAVNAELKGFPELLSALAYGHSLTYGVMATIIAILAGLLMTVIFKDRGGAH